LVSCNSRKVDCVEFFLEYSIVSIQGSQRDFLDELALNSGDIEAAFRVVGFANNGALVFRKVIII